MSQATGIEWTDATWNPIRGCSRVSEGCRHCYAESVAYRFSGPGQPYEGLVRIGADGQRKPEWNGEIRFVEEHLLDPLRWRKPLRIFVNSMSDPFHENVTDEMLDRIFAVMALCPQHTFQVLTKRPERMLAYLTELTLKNSFRETADGELLRQFAAYDRVFHQMVATFHLAPARALNDASDWNERHYPDGDGFMRAWPLPNVWLGVSVENQKAADERIPLLLQTPAAVRFLSVEPLLGPVNVHRWFIEPWLIDWVICGGESGPGARPMHPDWARSLRDQCQAAGVPFFFKQWGEWAAGSMHVTSGERVFRQFTSYQEWTHKGDTWINGGICLDATGKQMKNGGDMQAATYPVTIIHRVGKKAAGHLLDGEVIQQFPEVRA